jgi:uncharacterized membrane protein
MLEWSRPYSHWLYVVLAAIFIVLILIARRTAISDRLRSWLILLPRLLVFGAIGLILLNPVHRREHRLPAKPAHANFLVDASASMALDEPASRSTLAQQAIQEVDQQLQSLAERPRIQLFRFGERLSSAADLSQLQPGDKASLLAGALEQLIARFSREPPRAVVVFSDGAVQDADRLAEVTDAFKRINVPVHVFPVGNRLVRGDVAIDDLIIPPRVEAGTKVSLRGTVRGTGFSGERMVLQVRSAQHANLPPLATLPVTLTESSQPFELIVEANADYGELMLEAPPLDGEATTQNNRIPFELAKNRRKIKVVYMEGTAGNEYRWLRDALVEDQDIECLAMVADQQYVERPRLLRVDDRLRGFPATREELFEYDCVICSDISMGAFTREQLEWTVELVAERGGGFAMVGGHTSFGAGNWDQTAWDKLLPLDMAGGKRGHGWLNHQFKVRIPDEAAGHAIWRIVEDAQQNRRVLDAMPSFLGTNYMERLKPAATVLGVSAQPIPEVGIMPIFASQPYGRGRTFAFAPDSTADWGRYFESQWGEGDNRYFRRFWRNVVRWLCENSISGNKRLLAETDRVIYRMGQPINITAHAYDERLQETYNYEIVARFKTAVPGGDRSEVKPVPLAVQSGKFAGQIEAPTLLASGAASGKFVSPTFELEVMANHQGREVARTAARVIVLPDVREFLNPRPQPDVLAQTAQAAGGTVLRSSAHLAALLTTMAPRAGDAVVTKQPLWDSPVLWLLILGVLAFEWTLRRRAGYG